MNRRSFIKLLTVLAGAAAAPQLAAMASESIPLSDVADKDSQPYSLHWLREYDIERDEDIYRLDIKFLHSQYHVTCLGPLDAEAKLQMESILTRFVLKKEGIRIPQHRYSTLEVG